MKKYLEIIDLGFIEYKKACDFQKEIVEKRKKDLIADTLIMLEHPHTITLGRRHNITNILVDDERLNDMDVKLYTADRGGDVTYHGPGQLVIWPVLDLKNFYKDIHRYIRMLELVIIESLKYFNITAVQKKGYTGVWVNDKKIASIGIGVSRWVTYHGLSINIQCNLEYLSLVKPCGLNAGDYTDLSILLSNKIDTKDVKCLFVSAFKKVFDLEVIDIDKTSYMATA